jgi:hypothetical protein
MKKIKYKFLIFILFLAPLVQAIDSVDNNSKEPTIIVKPSCHETKQTIQDSMSMDCECENCTCGCIYNNLTVLNSNNSELSLYNNTSIVIFNIVIPYRESHPPFRPPIT